MTINAGRARNDQREETVFPIFPSSPATGRAGLWKGPEKQKLEDAVIQRPYLWSLCRWS
ncbi:hypothetical protein ATPR_2759 [Acetobacter tropicalis NBRC 101654]|uniref:Uncharacterized protein n=1 Tax=Acetobacter tropicalis NBRC 101654 TaxID=749388 RepID=F7VHB0_9PROT|nr:hypothetical protein ATPR_2759 [Acetobacter tropicalis NBRC 101654]